MRKEDIQKINNKINARGLHVDTELAGAGYLAARKLQRRAEVELRELCELGEWEHPDDEIIKEYLEYELGLEVPSLDTEGQKAILDQNDSEHVRRILAARENLQGFTAGKYADMTRYADLRGRIRNCFTACGTISGRYTSGGGTLNVHNLPHSLEEKLTEARENLRSGRLGELFGMFPEKTPAEVLTGLVRTCITAPAGKTLVMADFSTVEARILATLAGDHDRLALFAEGRDLYTETAEKLGSTDRRLGKVAELSCQYGAGAKAFCHFAGEFGIEADAEGAKKIIRRWAETNPKLIRFRQRLWGALLETMRDGNVYKIGPLKVIYRQDTGALGIRLPDGRMILYPEARLSGEGLSYEGGRLWSGSVTAHVVQGVGADILNEKLTKCEKKGLNPVGHVHDEIIIETPEGTEPEALCRIMEEPPEWMPELVLRAEGIASPFYRSY